MKYRANGDYKLQSAMEYLMTYGWAILIIAVALGALFGLGFFNSANLAPKVSAGSCQVYRPLGPGTTSFINTEGTCNNELPQYVAQFKGASYVTLDQINQEIGTNSMSYSVWFMPTSVPSGNERIFGDSEGNPREGYYLVIESGGTISEMTRAAGSPTFYQVSSSALTLNTWYFATATYDGSTLRYYIDGVLQGSTASSAGLTVVNEPMTIGADSGANLPFNGLIANFQVYNTSLSGNEVTALYDEGIGGVPLRLNNLVGWWPLNGNANDYSGNLNNGVPTSVIYTSSWTSGYTAP